MRIYSLKDFEKCTREQIKHYLKRWNVPFNSKSSTEVLRRKAMRSFQKEGSIYLNPQYLAIDDKREEEE